MREYIQASVGLTWPVSATQPQTPYPLPIRNLTITKSIPGSLFWSQLYRERFFPIFPQKLGYSFNFKIKKKKGGGEGKNPC